MEMSIYKNLTIIKFTWKDRIRNIFSILITGKMVIEHINQEDFTDLEYKKWKKQKTKSHY